MTIYQMNQDGIGQLQAELAAVGGDRLGEHVEGWIENAVTAWTDHVERGQAPNFEVDGYYALSGHPEHITVEADWFDAVEVDGGE
jgi:hypothetical protein